MTAFLTKPPADSGHWTSLFRTRLDDAALRDIERETGDHILNPDLGPYAKWDGPPRDAAVLIGIVERKIGRAHV